MNKILKYEVPLNAFTIDMPIGSVILTVQEQNNLPYIWVMGDSSNPTETRQFVVKLTGLSFDILSNNETYIGTFQLDGGLFVGHLFEL